MGYLSSCISEWDQADHDKLLSVQRGELVNAGVRDPSPRAIEKAIKREELACHCGRCTRDLLCLQDPPGVSLYTVTGSICKGGVTPPVLRCARGITSLESFHLHLARYVSAHK